MISISKRICDACMHTFRSSLLLLLLILPLLLHAQQKTDFLIKKCRKGMDDVCGYCSPDGKIVIRDGIYEYCFTDTFRTMAIVFHKDKGLVGIDREQNVLFTVYNMDNGPDYPSEGLFRIEKDGLLGFADMDGNVVIKPKFRAAWPFHQGLAAFSYDCEHVQQDEYTLWKGGKWGFVGKNGDIVIEPQYDFISEDFEQGEALVKQGDKYFYISKKGEILREYKSEILSAQLEKPAVHLYKEWTDLLKHGMRYFLAGMNEPDAQLKLKTESLESSLFTGTPEGSCLKAELLISGKKVAGYEIYPWQDLYYNKPNNDLISYMELVSVNPFSLVYKSFAFTGLPEEEQAIVGRLEDYLKLLKDNREAEDFTIPDGMQIISAKPGVHFLELQVAEPGTRMPEPETLCTIAGDRMLHLYLVPDIGPVRQSWTAPCSKESSASEKRILDYYGLRLAGRPVNEPVTDAELDEIRTTCREFIAGKNNNDEQDRLCTSLIDKIFAKSQKETTLYGTEAMFPDYVPKTTPDILRDFNPSLSDSVAALPAPGMKNLPELLNLLKKFQQEAKKNSGRWVEGNMILGADPKQYEPSDAELMAGEVGERIQGLITPENRQEVNDRLDECGIKTSKITYRRFRFRHSDVMGSGRFFYVESMEEVEMILK
ncbi:MAG: WG repeat-containing protein [Bacteroidetes bacterium]|nr:WG repeat-containing protein [Bacteroidota bacterium]